MTEAHVDTKAQLKTLLEICTKMSLDGFLELAFAGKIRTSEGPPDNKVGSSNTSLSLGLSEGYSFADICHFYLSRRLSLVEKEFLRHGEIERLLERRVEYAYHELCEDLIWELGFLHVLPSLGIAIDKVWEAAELERYSQP